MRDEWETSVGKNSDAASNNGGAVTPTDSYCFEMLSMVSALSGSNVGRSYLADQHDLLSNLSSLLHTGSARVQRQVREKHINIDKIEIKQWVAGTQDRVQLMAP